MGDPLTHPDGHDVDGRPWWRLCSGSCRRPLVPHYTVPGPGQARYEARGLCPRCYVAARRAGALTDYPRRTRTRDDLIEDWEFLRATGCSRRQAAERIGISLRQLERVIAG